MYRKAMQGWMKHMDFMVLDLLCLHFAFTIACMIRFGVQNPYLDYRNRSIVVLFTLADLLIMVFSNTFKNVLKRGPLRELVVSLRHIMLTVGSVLICLFSAHISGNYSRIMFYLLVGIYFLLSYVVRLLWKIVLLRKPARNLSALFLVTSSAGAEEIVRSLMGNQRLAYRLTGMAVVDRDLRGRKINGIEVRAGKDDIVDCLKREWVDEVLIALPRDIPCPEGLVEDLVEMGAVVHVRLDTDLCPGAKRRFVGRIGDDVVLTTSLSYATVGEAFAKRTMDIAGGIVGCLITGVLCIIIGPLIYINSPGPIFFSQIRVGKNGKKFKMYKFRSMCLDAEDKKKEVIRQCGLEDQMMFKLEWDPRIIGSKRLPDGTLKKGIGNYIRDWSLDEFPQFFNVLKGDMSLVGTRPPTVDEWERYEPRHRARLSVRPGITGLWQVSGRSSITDFEKVVELDRKYICEWSMGLDMRILVDTVGVVMRRDGAM